MKKYLLFALLILSLASCTSTKVELKKVNLNDTTIKFEKYNFTNFNSAFRTMHPEEALKFAKTESQKKAAKALEYITQNKYENAAETFVEAMIEKDSLEALWEYFPTIYYGTVNYNWEKIEKYKNIRNDVTDSSFAFYKNKPKFNIEFTEDSVVIPIELSSGLPLVKIKINGKYYYFLLDTGCNITLIGNKIAKDNNIAYHNEEGQMKTVDGSTMVHSGFLPELDLEQIKMSNIPVTITKHDDAVEVNYLFITFFQCDGIIGWDLLQNFDFTIDYKNEQLTLRKPVIKNVEQRNLFWYRRPIVKFYSKNNYPLLFLFDTGCDISAINVDMHPDILGTEVNELKKSKKRIHGPHGSVKQQYYKLPYFQCYTISNNNINYLTADNTFLRDTPNSEMRFDGVLGADWLKDKSIRVDMLNGIFEINE
jgi:hypothetical protein